jgi:hypothetical protein
MFSPSSARSGAPKMTVTWWRRCERSRTYIGALADVGRDDGGFGALGQVGSPTFEFLEVAVGTAPTFGVEQQIPLVFDKFECQLRAAAIDLVSINGNRVEDQNRTKRFGRTHEEVVHRRGDDRSPANAHGESREQQWCIQVAVVISDEDEGPTTRQIFQAVD